jgi:hypothetical protein
MLPTNTAVRSFDFDLDDERGFHYDGIIRGYVKCVTQWTEDGEPYEDFAAWDDETDAGCRHYAIQVLTQGFGHGARGHEMPSWVFPPVGENIFGEDLVVDLTKCDSATTRELADLLAAAVDAGKEAAD